MNKIIAIVGMSGCGKTDCVEVFKKEGYQFLRFGQIVINKVKEKNLDVNEQNERTIREEIRRDHGMAAMAIINIPKIDELLRVGSVVIDGLYSWSEYKVLTEKYKDNLTIIAIYASPKTRYARLENRKVEKEDTALNRRQISKQDAKARDYAEIENIEKAGPISMADYTIINEGTRQEYEKQIKDILNKIKN